jgi:hypothetical protein
MSWEEIMIQNEPTEATGKVEDICLIKNYVIKTCGEWRYSSNILNHSGRWK